jgi:hypothetical protein
MKLYDGELQVLEEHKEYTYKSYSPTAIAVIPGGILRCPFCDVKCTKISNSMIVCNNNPEHVIRWIAWGG